jgi:hypothetical protein
MIVGNGGWRRLYRTNSYRHSERMKQYHGIRFRHCVSNNVENVVIPRVYEEGDKVWFHYNVL